MSGPWTKCKINQDGFSNCNDLISNISLKYICWLIGILAILLNIISFVLQSKKNNYIYLAIIDCIFGVHLIIIASANCYYKGSYVGHEFSWKSSILCKLSSFFAFVSMMNSPLILCIIMIARYCVTKWPLTSAFRDQVNIKKFMKLSIIIVTFVCILLMLSVFALHRNHVPLGLCLVLYTSKEQSILYLLTSLSVISMQISCLIIIVTLATLLTVILFSSKNGIKLQTKSTMSRKVSINLFLVIMVMTSCWIPASVVLTFPIVGYHISNYLLSWIIIVVLPINSVLDPLLFSILTPEMRRKFTKFWNRLNS